MVRSIFQALLRAVRPQPSPYPPAATTLPLTSRVPLDEPLSSIHCAFSHDRRRAVAVGERTGRLWLLQIDPAARAVDARPLPVTVPRSPDGKDWRVSQVSGSHTLDRLLLGSDRLRVYAIPSGKVVAEPGTAPGQATCLSPNGGWLLSADEGRGWAMSLDVSIPRWDELHDLHRRERAEDGEVEELYLDHVDYLVAHPCGGGSADDEGDFWVAAACYGFVVIHRLEGSLWRVAEKSHLYGDFVYDPTDLLRPWGQRHVFVWHGYGTGLAALDPETGELHHCWIRGRRQQPYCFISGVVACGDAPLAWGSSKDGAFLWRVGHPPRMMPDPPGPVLALYPGALLCQSPEGDALLWCDVSDDLPPSQSS